MRGGPLSGYFQPVEIRVPQGALVALSVVSAFDLDRPSSLAAGLLVGEVYRFRITDIPYQAGREVFPTIELIDRLYPPPGQSDRFSIPVSISEQELEMALEGKYVTRVIYLEDPNQATPQQQQAVEDVYFEVAPGQDPLVAADQLGRPVAILRIGGRVPSSEGADQRFLYGKAPVRVVSAGSANTSSQEVIAPQCRIPVCRNPWQPAGLSPPWPSDEYLCDGGDYGVQVSVRANRKIAGLEQEDTVAYFKTSDGQTVIVPSNRVCIYAPRFGAVQQVVAVLAQEVHQRVATMNENLELVVNEELQASTTAIEQLEPVGFFRSRATDLYRGREQGGEIDADQGLISVQDALLPYEDFQIIRWGIIDRRENVRLAVAVDDALTWSSDQEVQVLWEEKLAVIDVSDQKVGSVYRLAEPDSPRLRLVKIASTAAAKPGETVDFTLRLDNVGNRVIDHVTLVDNLSTRLSYVLGSAQSSLETRLTPEENGAGSLVLRWEIGQPLQPGDGGTISFRCRVR